jgi:hypothetical protein
MGECFIMRRGGDILRLPVLDGGYPRDFAITVSDGQSESVTLETLMLDAGNPTFCTYQWYVDGAPVDGAVSATFTMDNIVDSAIHNVYCLISNRAGTVATRIATLSVSRIDSPVLDTTYPADASCDVYGSVVFETKIIKHGTSLDYSYQWYMDDTAVEGATSETFKVTNPSIGTHRVCCKVTSSAGTVISRVAALTVDTLILYASKVDTSGVTGGWVDREIEKDGGSLKYYDSGSTVNGIDLTNFSKLCFEGRIKHNHAGEDPSEEVGLGVWRYATNGVLRNKVASRDGNQNDFTIDVSRLSGKYYIGYYVEDSGDGYVSMKTLYLKV